MEMKLAFPPSPAFERAKKRAAQHHAQALVERINIFVEAGGSAATIMTAAKLSRTSWQNLRAFAETGSPEMRDRTLQAIFRALKAQGFAPKTIDATGPGLAVIDLVDDHGNRLPTHPLPNWIAAN